jgi:hypothetical protein
VGGWGRERREGVGREGRGIVNGEHGVSESESVGGRSCTAGGGIGGEKAGPENVRKGHYLVVRLFRRRIEDSIVLASSQHDGIILPKARVRAGWKQ